MFVKTVENLLKTAHEKGLSSFKTDLQGLKEVCPEFKGKSWTRILERVSDELTAKDLIKKYGVWVIAEVEGSEVQLSKEVDNFLPFA